MKSRILRVSIGSSLLIQDFSSSLAGFFTTESTEKNSSDDLPRLFLSVFSVFSVSPW
jgi:hypothetical protein